MALDDLKGKQFGYWTVIEKDSEKGYKGAIKWICQCKCGTIRSVLAHSLKNGRSQSCGCKPANLKGINKKHGESNTRLFHIWASMKKRCKNPFGKDAKTYKDRNITVCDEWNDYIVFRDWALSHGYDETLTIDRIDNDKGYSPENCRWITIEEQQRNKQNTIRVTYKGEQHSLRSLCLKLGFSTNDYKRIHREYQKMKANNSIDFNKLFYPYEYIA